MGHVIHSVTHAVADTTKSAVHAVAHTATTVGDDTAHVAVKAADGVAKGAKLSAPYLKWAGTQTWKGAKWCAADPTCQAAVKEAGTEAVEAAMALQLQELSFGSWLSGAGKTLEHGAEHAAEDLDSAAKAVGPYADWAAKETWKGATACASNKECSAAVKKYGTKAVEAAMKKKTLIIML